MKDRILVAPLGLLLMVVILAACTTDSTPAPDIEATVQAAVQATIDAQPTDKPTPDIEATLIVAIEATLAAQPTANPSATAPEVATAGDRPFRSYPAPTGYPGFRKYYQKRCYPGCHYDASEGTPTPQAIHP